MKRRIQIETVQENYSERCRVARPSLTETRNRDDFPSLREWEVLASRPVSCFTSLTMAAGVRDAPKKPQRTRGDAQRSDGRRAAAAGRVLPRWLATSERSERGAYSREAGARQNHNKHPGLSEVDQDNTFLTEPEI